MASANSTPGGDPFPSVDELAAKAVNKRYEGLVTVRKKAIKGKGAWYWAHLEPILIRNPTTNHPKAVKLKCSLCDAVFSASNPSRTATEHLKRGTCPNIASVLRPNTNANANSLSPLPLSSLPSPSSHNHRKRPAAQLQAMAAAAAATTTTTALEVHSLAMIEPARYCGEFGGASHTGLYPHHNHNHNQNHHNHNQLVLSGGKEDLGALAMLENSVKKLKSPKSPPGMVLSKDQIDSAIELLAEWFYESCGSVSLSSLENPKFRAFLNHVGLPAVSHRELAGPRLDAKFDEAKAESEARIEDAMFFQVASSGWKSNSFFFCGGGEENLVKFTVNLPNRTSVFHKAVFTGGPVSSKYAEEILWDSVLGICGSGSASSVQRCVGIVADKYKAKALKNLEIQNHWMVNLSCQLQGFISLIKDFNKDFPLFRIVTENCLKVANFVNAESQVRSVFQKYKMQELECCTGLLRAPSIKCDTSKNFAPVFAMLEDLLSCSRVLQMVVLDDSCKAVFVEDPLARDVARMVQSESFWNELEAVYSLVKMIRGMAQEIEAERPLVGQCLPLWEDLRTKIKEWCAKCSIAQEPVEKIVENRFRKMYHPAMAAAFILDPLNLIRDTSGKYLPPFKCLTHEQEKDVDKLITRLVSREEAHIALMEFMKWRSEGLDPLYAQAVQVKQRDPVTGKMKIANPQSSRLVWETCLSEFKSLGKVAIRLIFLQATSCGFKCNWSFMKWICVHRHSRVGLERAQKMIFVAAHAKLERRDLSNEEERDAELFASAGIDHDDMLNEVFADAHSV
ncbi:hypothetical protein L484_001979 [Morus notabilis]|uniref:DUF7963 domain-containing protein n=2 Tax=Morus notabilis TaxID=981085 RepID=W9QVP2_9ROSA|nr:hypothetical protein L484_001979 [Morus notabilis]